MMKKWLLGNGEKVERNSVFWNAAGGLLESGQMAIVLVFISRQQGIVASGVFTIAYAYANLAMFVGKYGIRNFQVTDIREQYDFGDYFYARIITVLSAFCIGVCYLIWKYFCMNEPLIKIVVVFELIIYKLSEAAIDLFLGRYQQVGRLDAAGKIMAVRYFAATAMMCVLSCFELKIEYNLLVCIVFSFVLDICMIRDTLEIGHINIGNYSGEKVVCLLKNCFPLCIGVTLTYYIGNIPRYVVDTYMDEKTQAVFGYIMLPVFVITLLSQFIYNPFLKKQGECWSQGNKRQFCRLVLRQCGIIVLITVAALTAGMWIGLPVLSWLYGIDLSVYVREFVVLFLSGGVFTIAGYLSVSITTVRKQKVAAIGCGIAVTVSILSGRFCIQVMGAMGAVMLYFMVNLMLIIFYSLVLFGVCRNKIGGE